MNKNIYDIKLNIYPTPKSIEYISGNYVEISKETNINITKDDNCCDGKDESYIIKITMGKDKKANISIIGRDDMGIHYATITLNQILEQKQNNKIPQIIIKDYPSIKYRGFIEGFYGYPWSYDDRISLIKDTSKYKFNTYIYAPKDDPYHRFKWKELYPKDKIKDIEKLTTACDKYHMNYCWTIHPGDTLNYTEEDFINMIEKFEQLYKVGVRQFGMFFDDTDDWKSGEIQAKWINRIDEEFVKQKMDTKPMIVVSARYNSAWGPDIDSYFEPFIKNLNKDIQVMWTGHGTMSNISKEVFEWPKKQTKTDKNMVVWWNYPVNDYCDSKLLMGPLHNLNTDLDNVNGFFSNPMNQSEASKVALFSIADYTWNTQNFEYMKSWETSIEKLVPDVSEEFKRFASNTSYLKEDGGASGNFEFDESWYLKEKIENFKIAITNNDDYKQVANDILNEFETMVSDSNIIMKKIRNKKLLEEIQVFLYAYKAIGEAGIYAINSFMSKESYDLAIEKLKLSESLKIKRLKEENKDIFVKEFAVSVGEKIIKPFIKDIINSY